MDRKEVDWHPSRQKAEEVEKESTVTERPRHDLVWRKAKGNGKAWVPRPRDPFYLPLLTQLRAGLDDGSYPEGHTFRDDWDTADRFSVSVSTLRHALGTLVQDFRMRSYNPTDHSRVWTYVVERWQPE